MIRLPRIFEQRSYVFIVHGTLAMLGFILLCIATLSGEPVVSQELFGPAVWQIEAEAWGAAMVASSGAVCAGLVLCRRALVLAGALLGLLTFGFLLTMADTAVAGDLGRLIAVLPFLLHSVPIAQILQEWIDDR